jgi:hypothetical protein
VIGRRSRYLRHRAVAAPARAAHPPSVPFIALMVVTLIALAGFAWSKRDTFYVVAQRAVIEDIPSSTRDRNDEWPTIEGAVSWKLTDGDGNPALEAFIDVPPVALTMTLTIRKNLDASLPASHIVEIVARVPPDFPKRAIADVGPLAFKSSPGERGTPLFGTMVKQDEDTYLMGLSPVPADIQANLKIMESNFLELPLTYASGQRGTLTFEKGSTGTPLFARALAAWREN